MPRDGFRHQPHARGRGRVGEDRAAAWLKSRGYHILERNFITPVGEIDLIARDGDTLVFVEVKARSSNIYGPAVLAVTPKKQRRLARVASFYLMRSASDLPCRFDVLGMDLDAGRWRCTLIKNAFEVPPGSFGR